MGDIAIKFENVSKKYRIGIQRKSIKDIVPAIISRFKRNGGRDDSNEIWALKDVSFEVKKGEAFGIIGPNGAGKSTILKILAGVTEPTRGQIQTNGKLSALIEIGAGFHPDLTGRENVYLNGCILGLSRKEIDRRFDDIVAFAELEKFIDTPVKRYSTGMYLRLGFSVAVFTDPKLLLVDEILAVGDQSFRMKCNEKMSEIRRGGATVILVTHNLGLVRHLCHRVMVMEEGRQFGPCSASEAVDYYQDVVRKQAAEQLRYKLQAETVRSNDGGVRITGVTWRNREEEGDGAIRTGYPLDIEIAYECNNHVSAPSVRVAFIGESSRSITECLSKSGGLELAVLHQRGRFYLNMPVLSLAPGCYPLKIEIFDQYGNPAVISRGEYLLDVHPGKAIGISGLALFYQDHNWAHIED